MLSSLLNSIFIILLGLSIGYLIQKIVISKKYHFSINIENTRKSLQKFTILCIVPINYIGVYWTMDLSRKNLLIFPLLCLLQLILGGSIAILMAKFNRLKPIDTGAYFCCGFFCNLGSIGGLICFIALGEQGYQLAIFYILFIQIIYYSLGFSIAKHYSLQDDGKTRQLFDMKSILRDPFIIVGIFSIVIGFSLNISGLSRPDFYKNVIQVLVPLSTLILLISIGLSMKFKKIRIYLKHALYISGIKFVIVPLIMVSLGILLGYHEINGGLPLKVLLIQSSTPVAFYALIPPSIYGLNLNLANSCWAITTLGHIFLLPLIFVLINTI